MSAASKVRLEHKNREIVVFERGKHTSFSACGMPYMIAGMVDSPDKLIARKPDVFREKQHIDVRIRHEVTGIEPDKKRVSVVNLENGSEFHEEYDDLLIATGASPVRPDMEGIGSEGVFGLSILQTGIAVFDFIRQHKPQKAVIVGGGYIGIEMAEALLAQEMHVSLIDMAPEVMITMDPDMGKLISEYMREQGVHLYLEEKLDHFRSENGRVTGVVTGKRTLDADLVILGMGVRPNSELAERAGIETGESAIRINKKMETSAEHVWAAGDCAESFHLISRKQVHIALGTVANKHGLIAGINIGGGNEEFPGVTGTAITKMKGLEIARTGLNEKEAHAAGIPFESAVIKSKTRSGYFPGSGNITVKLLAAKKDNRLIGGQIAGAEEYSPPAIINSQNKENQWTGKNSSIILPHSLSSWIQKLTSLNQKLKKKKPVHSRNTINRLKICKIRWLTLRKN